MCWRLCQRHLMFKNDSPIKPIKTKRENTIQNLKLKKLKENLEKSVFEREKSPNPYSDYGTNR
ncbi:MAG: hypothetical protein CFH35_00500 [Alphaproteobacteria bacterium MarineAlpha9_Bin5]|nr:MAG: hypothetical protein CFH36_00820 [Alphaproteobacteria bacterium MarineAlpha9_Bin6]PPR39511.1 MAG: hypothetical protein CFH35_00500 [Alphaproteobacteria bacterium MarineAlpha9_Bin5]